MTINEEIIKGKWLEIKGEIQKTWGKLTADEIEQTKGDMKSIAGLVMQKYGAETGKFQEGFSKIMTTFQDKKNEIVENLQDKKETAIEDIKTSLKS